MKTPDRELLDFQIFDMGFYEALEHYGLTEAKAEQILFGKEEIMVARSGQYVEPVEKSEIAHWSNDIEELKRVIGKYYETLFAEAGAKTCKTINSRSMSRYDIFSESIKQVLNTNPDFHFENDSQTLDYARSRIKRAAQNAERNERRSALMLEYRDDLKCNSIEADIDFRDSVKTLNEEENEVLTLIKEGYSQEEVGQILKVCQKTISNRVARIRKNLKAA